MCSVEHQNLKGHLPRRFVRERVSCRGGGSRRPLRTECGQLPPAEPPGCSAAIWPLHRLQTGEDSHNLSLSLSLSAGVSLKSWEAYSFTLRKVEEPAARSKRKLLWGNLGRGVTGSLASVLCCIESL